MCASAGPALEVRAPRADRIPSQASAARANDHHVRAIARPASEGDEAAVRRPDWIAIVEVPAREPVSSSRADDPDQAVLPLRLVAVVRPTHLIDDQA
jgi:hypothetical protein